MDLKRIRATEYGPKVSVSITSALVSAFLEWILIFMLFVYASFSYLVTMFARYSQLQIPCVLCSRLDHVMGNQKAGFYWDLICHKHKLKISSLILCQLHNNLVDVHGTCENCFFSFATVNKSNAETYRLLVGKLGAEPHGGLTRGASAPAKCTCCNEQKISKSIASDNLISKLEHMWDEYADPLTHVEYSKINVNSDTESEAVFSDNESCGALIREMESSVQDTVAEHVLQQEPQINTLAECSAPLIKLSHVEADETTIPSCNLVSNAPLEHGLEELSWQQAEHRNDVNALSELISFAEPIPSPHIVETHYDESKETNDSFCSELGKEVHIEVREASNEGNDSTVTTGLCKEVTVECAETSGFESDSTPANEIQFESKPNDSFSNELGKEAHNEVRESSNTGNDSTGTTELCKEATVESAETSRVESDSNPANEIQLDSKSNGSVSNEMDKVHIEGREASIKAHDSPGTVELCKEVTLECAETSRVESDYSPANDSTGTIELCKEVTVECAETSLIESDSTPANEIQFRSKPNETESLDLGDAYKLALGTRGRQLSGRLLEQKRSMTDSTRASEDLKVLLSQISVSRGVDISSNDMSPRMSANNEDLSQIYQRRISLERNESNLSLDGSTISEIEGESVVDRLKRQVEHDKKMMGTLYKELEEERNASAVAANQAMAMITRLQEEKASLHMEALQYLRMMEEQAEYDGEALQNANELLTEREKQIQDLEFEIELYKNQLGDISLSDNFVKSQTQSNATVFHNSDNDDNNGTISRNDEAPSQEVNSRTSLPHFEEEKQYILLCLEKLEKKLFNEVHTDVVNDDFSAEEVLDPSASEKLDSMEVSEEKNHLPRDTLLCKEALPLNISGHEKCQSEGIPKLRSSQSSDADLYTLRDELYDMNNRLEALEAEQNFIECSINSLEKGSAGFEFIQEIALRLRELHSALTRTRNEDLT